MKLVVARFCRAKDHEIINEDAECERSENAMQLSHHHQVATNLLPRSQSLRGRTKFTTSGARDVIAITSPQKNDLCTEELRD